MASPLTFAIDLTAPPVLFVAEANRQWLEGIGISAEGITGLAAQRNVDIDSWDLPSHFSDAEKALPEATRAYRRVQTLLLNALQEDADDA